MFARWRRGIAAGGALRDCAPPGGALGSGKLAAAAAPAIAFSYRPMPYIEGRKPRVAIIGYGFAGRRFHAYLVSLAEGLGLRGIASRSEETRQRIREECGCVAYSSFEAVLEDPEVDLVVLATPSHLHAEPAVAAMEAGKHVVTDKPMAASLKEADAMIATSERTGSFLAVFQNRRWDGDFLTLRKLIGEGRLGRPRRIEMAWGAARPPKGWRATAQAAGGRLYDLGSHMIDQICLLFPQRIQSVYARLQYDNPDLDVETDAVVAIGFEDGATGLVEASSIACIPKPRIYATGLEGTFVKHGLDPQERYMIEGRIDEAVEPEGNYGRLNMSGNPEDDVVVPTERGRWRTFYESVARTLTEDAPHPAPLDTVRRQMAVLDAAFRSARAGASVKAGE